MRGVKFSMKKIYTQPQLIGESFIANEYVAACYSCLDMGSHSKNFSAIYVDADKDGILDANETTTISASFRNDCGQTGSGGRLAHYISDEQLADPAKCTYVIIVRNNGSHVPAIKITGRMSDNDSYGGEYPHFCDRQSNASA